MSVFDLIIFAILIALAFRGWMTGMVAQIVSVGSFAVSWIVASRFAFLIAPSIPAEEPWNNIGAMIVLFVITLVAIRLSHSYLEKKIKDLNLAKLNHYLGGLLGFVKGLLLCMIVTFFGVMVSEATRDVVFKSKTGNHLVRLIEATGAFIPPDSYELLQRQFALFKAKVNGTQSVADTSGSISPEEESLQKLKNSLQSVTQNVQNLKEQGENKLNSLIDTAQSLKQKNDQATSLIDAVQKWWSGFGKTEKTNNTGSTNKTESTPNTPVAELFTKTPPETPKPIIPAIPPNTPTLKSATEKPTSSLSPPDPSNLAKISEVPIAVTVPPVAVPARSDGALFRRQQSSETNQPIANQLESLQISVLNSPPNSSPNSEPPVIAVTPMSIPRSSARFRLLGQFSANASDRLLDPSPTKTPATLFTPKR